MSLSCNAHELEWEVFLTVEYFPPLAECSERPAGHSQHSQHSRPVWAPFEFDAAEVDAFEERAAIMEFDGGLERNAAEVKALISVLAGRSTSQANAARECGGWIIDTLDKLKNSEQRKSHHG